MKISLSSVFVLALATESAVASSWFDGWYGTKPGQSQMLSARRAQNFDGILTIRRLPMVKTGAITKSLWRTVLLRGC